MTQFSGNTIFKMLLDQFPLTKVGVGITTFIASIDQSQPVNKNYQMLLDDIGCEHDCHQKVTEHSTILGHRI